MVDVRMADHVDVRRSIRSGSHDVEKREILLRRPLEKLFLLVEHARVHRGHGAPIIGRRLSVVGPMG